MLKQLHILTTALLVTVSSVSFAEDDDLFSDFSARSVFSESTDSKSASGVPERATSGEDLRELLKAAGFEAKAAGSRVATTEKKLEPWTFPIKKSHQLVFIEVSLAMFVITSETEISS